MAYDLRGKVTDSGRFHLWSVTRKHPENCPCEYAGYYTTVYATRDNKTFYDTEAGFPLGTTDDEIREFIAAMKEGKRK
jgi:hypothetical protein